jgi:hypothetical protein
MSSTTFLRRSSRVSLALVLAVTLAASILPLRPAVVLGVVADPVTVSVPELRYRAGATLSTGLYPVQLTWTRTGATPAARYQVQVSKDAGAFATIGSPAGTSLSTTVASGHTYVYRVRGLDASLTTGDWAESPALPVRGFQETSASFAWAGYWATGTNSYHWGGHTRFAGVAGRSATFTFTGRSAAIVAPVGPTRGSMKVYVDGLYRMTVSTYASTNRYRRIVYAVTWVEPGPHTVRIVVVGTPGHPRVEIDGMAVLQ